MGARFEVDIDVSAIVGKVGRGVDKGLQAAVEHILTEANKSVPHDEGTLERSGSATVVSGSGSRRRGAVSYDTPYAVRQHEDMTLHHHGKGRSKWLESTLHAEASTTGQIIARSIRAETGG